MRHDTSERSQALPPLWLRRCRSPNRKIRRRGDGFLGQIIGDGNFELVVAWRQRSESNDVFKGQFFAMLGQLILSDIEFEDRIGGLLFGYAIFHRSIRFVGLVVDLEVVDLKENAHLVAGTEVGVNLGTHFYIAENELAQADV